MEGGTGHHRRAGGRTARKRGDGMAGQILTVTSGKGGVGKTTTTANIGTALAMLGRSVVLIDADIGLRNLDIVMGLENRIVYDLVDVVEGTCRVRQAMIRDKRFPNLSLIPAAQTRDKDSVTPRQMVELTRELAAEHDFVIVDSPAGIEQGFRNAIAGANRVLVVTTPEVSAVRDADRIIGLVEAAEIPPPSLIVNRFRPEMVRRGDMMDVPDVEEILAIALIGVVPEDVSIITSTNRGEAAVFDGHSAAGLAFRDIARRLNGEEVHFPRYEPPAEGMMVRLRRAFGFA